MPEPKDVVLEDDNTMFDDSYGGVPEESEGQPQTQEQEKVEELLFAIQGEDGKEQQLPLSKLTPVHVKPWYEAHQNRQKWQAENTKKAQEVAEQRRAFEAEQAQHRLALEQLDNWTNYFRSNKGLQELVSAYVQGRIPQAMLSQFGGAAAQGAQGQPAGVQQPAGPDPYLNQMVQRLAALERSIQEDQKKRLQQEQLAERERAIQAVLPELPEAQREAFKQYMEQATGSLSNLTDMYKLLAGSFNWQTNRESIAKQAEQKTLENIQKKKAAAVETGTQQSAIGLPENVDLSGVKDLDRIFEKFGESIGAYE